MRVSDSVSWCKGGRRENTTRVHRAWKAKPTLLDLEIAGIHRNVIEHPRRNHIPLDCIRRSARGLLLKTQIVMFGQGHAVHGLEITELLFDFPPCWSRRALLASGPFSLCGFLLKSGATVSINGLVAIPVALSCK